MVNSHNIFHMAGASASAQIPCKIYSFHSGERQEAYETKDVKALCFELVISKRHVIQIRRAGIFFIQLIFIGYVFFFLHLLEL